MSAYLYITISLLVYPIFGWLLLKLTKKSKKNHKLIIQIAIVVALLVVAGYKLNIITISQNLNWFLITAVYLSVSLLLWITQYNSSEIINGLGQALIFVVFGTGYLAAVFGFFFIAIVSLELQTAQRVWLTSNLIYQERNIGSGPDPSTRRKEIEVYHKLKWFPLLANKIYSKTYDELDMNVLLQGNLNVSFSNENNTLRLTSRVEGYKVWDWSDSIHLVIK